MRIAAHRFAPQGAVGTAGDFGEPAPLDLVGRQGVLLFVQAAKQLSREIGALLRRQLQRPFEDISCFVAHAGSLAPLAITVERRPRSAPV